MEWQRGDLLVYSRRGAGGDGHDDEGAGGVQQQVVPRHEDRDQHHDRIEQATLGNSARLVRVPRGRREPCGPSGYRQTRASPVGLAAARSAAC